ncbi:MAG: TRAP transporter fused permease subunit [bacterium]
MARAFSNDGITAGLAVLLIVGGLAWAGDLYRMVGLLLYPEQFLSGMLAVVLPLLFLKLRAPGAKGGAAVPWYDRVAAVVGMAAFGYMAYRYPVLAELVSDSPTDGVVAGVVILVLMVEGLRRTVGPVLTVMAVGFFLLGVFGEYIPGSLAGRPISWEFLTYYLSWDPNGILGIPMKVVATIVTAFVFFGQVLMKAGGSAFFTDISMVLVGRFRGGQAKIAVTASGLFGSISGSAVSNVVTTGIITIPLMRRAGYRVEHAAAIEAVASTGGQLMPPIMGAAAFLMAEFLEIPYTEVVVAALIPAILYYLALFILADLEAAKAGITRVPPEDIPDAWPVLKAGWFFPIPFAVLIVSLFVYNYTPEKAALLATVILGGCAFIFGYQGKRLGLKDVFAALRDTGVAVLDIFMIAAAAGIVIGVLDLSGMGFGLTLALVEIGGGSLPLLLVISAGVCILLGMGMPTAGVYLVLATLIAPSLVEVGIQPIAAHLFILYFGMMSMITPPVAIAAFAAASLAGCDAMKTGFAAMRFGWLAYVIPFLFVASPSLIMQGEVLETVIDVATALCGVWLVSAGLAGHLFRPLTAGPRALLVISGLLLLIPAGAMEGGSWTDLAGLVIGLAVGGRDLMAARKPVADGGSAL